MRSRHPNLYDNEKLYYEKYHWLAGVDEAGRGPLAGPLVVAAVILSPSAPIEGVYDSKQLNAQDRESLYEQIVRQCLCYAVVEISPAEIDAINILQATLKGMKEAIESLAQRPDYILIDGNQVPEGYRLKALPVIKGDCVYASIAAASIVAKVTRDRIMDKYHAEYPQYGFLRNKGYGTPEHLKALDTYGPCPIHRMSFTPVQQASIWQFDKP